MSILSIYEYIAQNSLRYAQRTVDRITARSKRLIEFPLSGQMVPEYSDQSIQEVIEGNYRIIYEVTPEAVYVLAIIHGMRALPDEIKRATGAPPAGE